jgi:hypothetical protein
VKLLLKFVTVQDSPLNHSTFPLAHTTPQVQSVSPAPAAMILTLTDAKKHHIKRVSLVILLLLYHNSLRDRLRLLRQSVVQANEAPWHRIFLHGDSTSFLHMTGLTHEVFRSLVDYLFDLVFIARHHRRGRLHSLPPDGYLGIFLFYLGNTTSYKHLCMFFGISPSVCSHIINKMLSKVVKRLRNHPFAQVRFPDEHKMREYVDMVQL